MLQTSSTSGVSKMVIMLQVFRRVLHTREDVSCTAEIRCTAAVNQQNIELGIRRTKCF